MDTLLLNQLVLASASPARLRVLRAAGLHPLVITSAVDEDAIIAARGATVSPTELVVDLARAKAQSVAAALPPAPGMSRFVLGCDSMLETADGMVGKPHDPEVALRRVLALRGTSPVLHTGHWLLRVGDEPDEGMAVGKCASTVVHFTDFSPAEARAYVATGEPLEVAGAFTIDGFGSAFIAGVTGDPHNVVGVSLSLLRELLSELGAFYPDFWVKESTESNA